MAKLYISLSSNYITKIKNNNKFIFSTFDFLRNSLALNNRKPQNLWC